MGSLLGESTTEPVFTLCRSNSGTRRPARLKMPPRESLTAMIFAPCRASNSAAMLPAFPKPWMATVARSRLIPMTSQAERITNQQPRAVASLRPKEPPRNVGLPVTTPGALLPWVML